MNLNQSSQQHLDVAAEVLTEVATTLNSLQADSPKFNVSKYAKATAEKFGVEELFVAYLVRSVVNNCDDFESKRGRAGGVGRVSSEPAAVVSEAPETPAAELSVAADATPADIAEAVSEAANDTSADADIAIDV